MKTQSNTPGNKRKALLMIVAMLTLALGIGSMQGSTFAAVPLAPGKGQEIAPSREPMSPQTPPIVVDTNNDVLDAGAGDCYAVAINNLPGPDQVTSLREAICAANNNPGADTITFAIPGSGVHTITPGSDLPAISDAVTINGLSQSGATCSTWPPTLAIELNGSNTRITGLLVNAGPSTITGLVINRFTSAGIQLNAGNSNIVQSNFLGTDPSGTLDRGNGSLGLNVYTANNLIGGTGNCTRNLISGNDDFGVAIYGLGATNNLVQNNYIGTDVNGTAALPNTFGGVRLQNSANGNTIGGTTPAERNIISGNTGKGVEITLNTFNNTVRGNYIGVKPDGVSALGNGSWGVYLLASAGSGGSNQIAGNIIANNTRDGVAVVDTNTVHNLISGNSIHDNGGLGIDLADDGVTPNDLVNGDLDTGPNNLQNYPILTSVTSNAIVGSLNSTTGTIFKIGFFASPVCDPSHNGEGQQYLGNLTTNPTDSNGDVSFTFLIDPANAPPSGWFITMTATDPAGNTSEFSFCDPTMPAQTPPCAPPPPGLVAWYPMDEEDGTTLRDLTGAYNGTYYNNPTSNPGFVLRSRQFDGLPGNSQWGEALTAPNFIAGTDLTIDAWIKPLTTSSGLRPIVDKRAYINGPSYTGPIGYAMNVTGGYLTFQLDAQGSSASYVMTSPALNDGKWHFVAAVVHRTSPYLVTLWVDGTSQTFAAPQVTGDLTNSARLFIAREYSHPGGSPHFFSGSIDEVEIFNRALDPTELDDIYRAGSSGKCKCYLPPAHMTAWYMLDELAGVGIAHDSVSPASDATYSTSGPAVIPGMVDNALAFDGSANDYATAPAPAAGFTGDINLDPDTDTIQSFTIDAWVRIYSPNPSTTWWMLDKRDAATHGYSFYINSSKKLVLRMGSFTATSTTTIPLNTTTNTTWAFVAVAVNRNTGKGRLYINGVPGPLFTPPSYSVYNPNALLFANHYVAGAGGQFIPSTQPSHLDLDEVEFFDRALTSTQIMALYNAQGAGKCKPYVRSMPVPTPTPIAPPVGMLDGHLTWQGVTQPNDQNTDRAAILNVCAAGLTNSYIVTTDESGNFSMDLELPDGSYDWQVQGDRSLANAGTIAGGNPLVMSGGAATLEVGTQKAGDASNDNIVNTLDFNILKPTFGRGSGDAGYDERSDFNNDNLANTSDFNLLKGNFGVDGRALTCP